MCHPPPTPGCELVVVPAGTKARSGGALPPAPPSRRPAKGAGRGRLEGADNVASVSADRNRRGPSVQGCPQCVRRLKLRKGQLLVNARVH